MIPIFIYIFLSFFILAVFIFTYPFFIKIEVVSDLYEIYIKLQLGITKRFFYITLFKKNSKTIFFEEGKKIKDVFDLVEVVLKRKTPVQKRKKKSDIEKVLKLILKEKHKVHKLKWSTSFGSGDVIITALSNALIWTFKTFIITKLLSHMMSEDFTEEVKISVNPLFNELNICVDFFCIVRIVPGYLILKDIKTAISNGLKNREDE